MPRLALPPVCRGGGNRGNSLGDADLERAYERFLQIYGEIPRTLCHDDLLPSMCFCSGDRAVLIDWEYALILPYPTSLARLIAHGEEDENAFFHMTQLTGNLPFNPILNISSGKRE